jgi:hypothetical protein
LPGILTQKRKKGSDRNRQIPFNANVVGGAGFEPVVALMKLIDYTSAGKKSKACLCRSIFSNA